MRTWTLIVAGLVTASVAATAAVLPEAQQQQPSQERPKAAPPRSGDENETEPGREVRRRVEVLGGRDVQIGVTIRDLEGDQARDASGAVVAEVRDDSPAAKAGLTAGDIIVEFDGERVRSARHLSRIVGESAAGRTVKAVVQRDGRRVDLQVTPEAGMAFFDGPRVRVPGREFTWEAPGFRFDDGALRDMLEGHRGRGDMEGFEFLVPAHGRGRLGIGVQDLTPQLAEFFGTTDGVLVTSVEPSSPAAAAGLRAGDVITAVGDTAVSSPADVTRAVRRAEDGTDLSITYTRDKKSATTKAKIEPRQKERSKRPGQPI